MMLRVATLVAFLFTCGVGAADDWIIPVAGHVPGANGTFWRTELELFNPEANEIAIDARLIGDGASTVTIAVAPQVTRRFSDVLQDLFGQTGVVAIHLHSAARFEATSRTFTEGACGAYGQFVPAVSPDAAVTRGLLLHLSADVASRTNIGFVNDSDLQATVTLRPLDEAARSLVVAARSMTQFAQLARGPLRFDSNVPVIGYVSIIDNASGDATFVLAVSDRSEPARVFDIEARQFRYVVTPGGVETIHVRRGDRVVLRLHSTDALHGFLMPDVVPHQTLVGGAPELVVTFVADRAGTFPFFCTIECGSGHHGMGGQMVVSP